MASGPPVSRRRHYVDKVPPTSHATGRQTSRCDRVPSRGLPGVGSKPESIYRFDTEAFPRPHAPGSSSQPPRQRRRPEANSGKHPGHGSAQALVVVHQGDTGTGRHCVALIAIEPRSYSRRSSGTTSLWGRVATGRTRSLCVRPEVSLRRAERRERRARPRWFFRQRYSHCR